MGWETAGPGFGSGFRYNFFRIRFLEKQLERSFNIGAGTASSTAPQWLSGQRRKLGDGRSWVRIRVQVELKYNFFGIRILEKQLKRSFNIGADKLVRLAERSKGVDYDSALGVVGSNTRVPFSVTGCHTRGKASESGFPETKPEPDQPNTFSVICRIARQRMRRRKARFP